MPHRTSILVLMGGPDAEREVSLMSGKAVAAALREAGRFDVVERVIETPDAKEIAAMGGEVVFPVLHGHWGEGGPLQTLLEEAGLPYIGSRPGPSRRAMDKLVTKMLLSTEAIPTPRTREVRAGDECDLEPPLVLKPVDDGSSVDLRICRTAEEVARGCSELHAKRGRLMAEQYIAGREVTAGILFDEPLPLIEVIPDKSVEFYDYEAKYLRDDTRYVLDPELPPGLADEIQRMAMTAFTRLGCRDLARVDFMVDARGPWFLEINTMPGFTSHSLVPMAAKHRGWSMADICARLADIALERGPARKGTDLSSARA